MGSSSREGRACSGTSAGGSAGQICRAALCCELSGLEATTSHTPYHPCACEGRVREGRVREGNLQGKRLRYVFTATAQAATGQGTFSEGARSRTRAPEQLDLGWRVLTLYLEGGKWPPRGAYGAYGGAPDETSLRSSLQRDQRASCKRAVPALEKPPTGLWRAQ